VFNSDNYDDVNTNAQTARKRRPAKKITPQRLKNIGLYYLQRFESSVENLRQVLHRRVDVYAKENPQWNKNEALQWIEDVLAEFEKLHYLDDNRYAEIKIRQYLDAGKPARYIQQKLQQKGISPSITNAILAEAEFDPLAMALKLAHRKKIGPFRAPEQRREYRQKDLGTLVRAGFDYDIACQVLEYNPEEE
jgi:regulatory protein